MKRSELAPSDSYEATYCPEDDKLRLYVGRVPRAEFEFLRSEGWTSTPKQDCDFVAVWNPSRHATAIQYAGFVGDEDTPPTERDADRAERFNGYRENRIADADRAAGMYESGGRIGFQYARKAERAEKRFDRQADKAGDQWEKAEYWQRRTAGVISHALYKSSPEVRMGRIKTIEADRRRIQKSLDEYAEKYKLWQGVASMTDEAKKRRLVSHLAGFTRGEFTHPRTGKTESLWRICEDVAVTPDEVAALWLASHGEPQTETEWTRHLDLRLAYEHQMLEAQGGRAAMVEMEVGGWLEGDTGRWQIRKINKSPATGRVVSVQILSTRNRFGRPYEGGKGRLVSINIERLEKEVYTPPTEEDKAALAATKKAEKAAAPKAEPCPLINPTDEDAEKLQSIWNQTSTRRREKPGQVVRITQAQYSAASGGAYARAGTVVICETGNEHRTRYGEQITRHDVFKVRKAAGGMGETDSVIILTDKPQKPIPWDAVEKARAKCPTIEGIKPRMKELERILNGGGFSSGWTPEEQQLAKDAEYLGLASLQSLSQNYLTETGKKLLMEVQA
jgi:hypothetical protein